MATETFQIAHLRAGPIEARLFIQITEGMVDAYAHITEDGRTIAEASYESADQDMDSEPLLYALEATATEDDEHDALVNILERWDALREHYGWEVNEAPGMEIPTLVEDAFFR